EEVSYLGSRCNVDEVPRCCCCLVEGVALECASIDRDVLGDLNVTGNDLVTDNIVDAFDLGDGDDVGLEYWGIGRNDDDVCLTRELRGHSLVVNCEGQRCIAGCEW